MVEVNILTGGFLMAKIGGSIEIGRPLDAFPQWTEMLERHRKNSLFKRGSTLVALGGMTWDKFASKMKGRTDIEKIKAVNALWNARPWKSDVRNWGRSDFWATPLEFCMKGGDCEDAAIAKMLSLKELGVNLPMRVLVGEGKDGSHALVAIELEGRNVFLDNWTDRILEEDAVSLVPKISMNEEKVWAHLAGGTKKA